MTLSEIFGIINVEVRVTRLTLRPPTPESLLRLSCSLPGLPLPDMNLSLAGAGWGQPSSLAWGPMLTTSWL